LLRSTAVSSADMFLDKKRKEIRDCSHYQNNNDPD